MTLTIGSLFAGIGGLELGLERAGLGPVLWQAEQDPFCRRVLAKHWPDARRYQDVRAIDERAERPDIICGGFPCQDISLAGSGGGLEGERSGLWREFARIVRVLRPRFVVIENVPALRMRGLCSVLRDLAACGYDAEWDCIPAAAIGAPHRRDRLYVVARRVSDTFGDAIRYEPKRGEGPALETNGWDAQLGYVCAGLVDPDSEQRRGRRTEAGGRVTPDAGEHLVDPDGQRLEEQRGPGAVRPEKHDAECTGGRAGPASMGPVPVLREPHVHDSQSARVRMPMPADRGVGDQPVWPPAPDDMQAWGRVPASSQPAVCRVADELPDRAHRLKALGNSVVPAVAEVIGRVIVGMA